jgi:NADH-quinone oxidoreductase subunit L
MPLLGFIILSIFQQRLDRRGQAIVGVGSVGLSAVLALIAAGGFLSGPGKVYVETIWSWMAIGKFTPQIAFHLDALSLVMMLVVTVVGFLIHLYSSEFMGEDKSFARFFAYMNLFVFSMLILVLGNNLVFLFFGWEGVGLCSYLLIGFWYEDPDNVVAARKAFVVTRIGDAAMIMGLFLIFTNLGTLNIQELMVRAHASWTPGSPVALAAAALLLGGAVGKSAQLPLQTWLPDAMAGPTPVSALIHAATMVTAGMYLIARTHVLFTLAPAVQHTVAAIGVATLLIASFAALSQRDIKRILAYSTISQIGYMFLALGVGAWWTGIFHFMIHAFFKALLFLSAGAVILAVHHEHDIYKMGGLRRRMPFAFWGYLIGSASLAAFPLITAGFYSKDTILAETFASPLGGPWLWGAGLIGAFLTSVYIFRSVFVAFFGEVRIEPTRRSGPAIVIPLVTLSVLALIGGFIGIPATLGGFAPLADFLHTALPANAAAAPHAGGELSFRLESWLQIMSSLACLLGIAVAWALFYRRAPRFEELSQTADARKLDRLWASGWGFDWLYDRLFVRPYLWFAHVNYSDVVDGFYSIIAMLTRMSHLILSDTQSGRVRWYATGVLGGAMLLVAIGLLI